MAEDGHSRFPRPLPSARERVRAMQGSRIREVANQGFGMTDLARFWVGESDEPTPEFVRDAAIEALMQSRTFYTHNRGVAELREALGEYLRNLHGVDFEPDRLSITSAGVNGLMVAMQAVVEPGDRVVAVTPVWPNLVEIPWILGADVVRVSVKVQQGVWRLDLDELIAAITPETRIVLFNSPNNPTGWTLREEDRAPLLEHCRRLGVWLLCDDVYERLAYAPGPNAPSILAMADPEDRVIGANSFSKAWRMTGWRLGWLVTPPSLEPELGKLLEFNTSCAPEFVQHAATAALRQGEPFVADLRTTFLRRRDALLAGLAALPGVEATRPDGGMYVLVRIEGEPDSMALARKLIAEARLGLAPGRAFGPEAEGWMRWCFAVADDTLADGIERLAGWLARR
jgi:aspartate/methionine/tyrosine aminotransferase